MEAATEVYQFITTVRSAQTTAFGYYLSIATTLLGFYFLWRGLHEWNRLSPRQARSHAVRVPWTSVSFLVGGIVATAVLDGASGTVGSTSTPPVLAWIVGGVMVLAFGSFFLNLRRMVAPYQSWRVSLLGWGEFVWALGVSVVAGLALGKAIVELFINFFTSWPALILNLAPFIFDCAPLFVTFGLLSIGYAMAYRNAPSGPDVA